MKSIIRIFLLFFVLFNYTVAGLSQDTEEKIPEPIIVNPGKDHEPPSDAIILFGSDDLSRFESVNGGEAKWNVKGNHFTVNPGAGNIHTLDHFGDCQLHIEWRTPQESSKSEGQKSGNSGIYLMGKYEVQILNSKKNKTYPDGQAGAIYRQYAPMVNASRAPGEWQVYDIIFIAPRYDEEGAQLHPPVMTVFHNGVLIHHSVNVKGPTTAYNKELPEQTSRGPLMLQDHSNEVSYRNIWIRELNK